MRKLPLVVVEWEDTSTHGAWKGEADDFTSEIEPCVSVGWKLKSTRKHLRITAMRTIGGACNDRQSIPRGCIKNIRRLE